jgi:hypothetical protein
MRTDTVSRSHFGEKPDSSPASGCMRSAVFTEQATGDTPMRLAAPRRVASDDGTTITGTRDSPFGQLKILGSEKAPLATSMM